MNVKIVSDSTCDLTQELLQRYDIGITPLYVVKEGKSFRDGVDISLLDIFKHVDGGGDLCTTSACSISDYDRCFAEYADKYDAVIQITIGSGFSSCYQNACIAAGEYPNVYVVDSENLSTGQGEVVIAAAEMAAMRMDVPEIIERLEELIPRVEISFLIERLNYMVRGGRCSAVSAFGANLLNLKPCIEVKNGKMVMVKKYRGGFVKCVEHFSNDRLKDRKEIEPGMVFITHAVAPKEAVQDVWQKMEQNGLFREIVETNTGCAVSCHCGPHTMGITVVRK